MAQHNAPRQRLNLEFICPPAEVADIFMVFMAVG